MSAPGPAPYQDLLQRIAHRDQQAVAELYAAASPVLLGVIRRILQDRGEAEEVLQDVFLRVWHRVDSYDAMYGSPMSWLVRIARNRAIDRFRSRKVRAHLADRPIGEHDAGRPSADDSPEIAVVRRADRQLIGRALGTLRADQRTLIEDAFFGGLTHTELAARHNVPLGTVKTRIRTGLAALRDGLADVGGQLQ